MGFMMVFNKCSKNIGIFLVQFEEVVRRFREVELLEWIYYIKFEM